MKSPANLKLYKIPKNQVLFCIDTFLDFSNLHTVSTGFCSFHFLVKKLKAFVKTILKTETEINIYIYQNNMDLAELNTKIIAHHTSC